MKKLLLFILSAPLLLNAQIFYENFTNTAFPPTGWTLNQLNADQTWHRGTGGVARIIYDDNINLQNEDLITPAIDLSVATAATLTFDTSLSYSWSIYPDDNYDTTLHISTDGGSTWTQLWNENDLAIENGGTFEDYYMYSVSINLNSYVGNGNSNVKLKFNYYGADGATWSVDNIKIIECGDIGNLTVTSVSDTTIDLVWDGTHSTYNLEYGPAGFTQGSGTVVNNISTPNFQITELSEATAYDVYVSGVCSSSIGAWNAATNIYTNLVTPTNLNYTNNFDAPVPLNAQGWSVVNNGSGYNWIMSSDPFTSHSPDNYLYSPYNSDFATDTWLFSRGIYMNANEPMNLTFWYKIESEDYPEKMKVTVGTDKTVAEQTTVLWDNNGGNQLTNTTYVQGTADFIAPTTGVYYFAFNCYSEANMYYLYLDTINFSSTLEVEDVNSSSSASVITPNPAKDSFSIKISELFNIASTTINILDISGKTVASFDYAESFNISHLPKGVYLISISDGKNHENKKLIKK